MSGISNSDYSKEEIVVEKIYDAIHDYDNLMGYTPKKVVDRIRGYIKEFDDYE